MGGQSGEAFRWRVCHQRGQPCLVLTNYYATRVCKPHERLAIKVIRRAVYHQSQADRVSQVNWVNSVDPVNSLDPVYLINLIDQVNPVDPVY